MTTKPSWSVKTKKAIIAFAFLSTIVLANVVTSKYGQWPVWWGLMATAGTYFAGVAFVLRDLLQDIAGRTWVIMAILTGAIVSYSMSAAAIATASVIAFLVSELVDWAIYTPLRKHGYFKAAAASNFAGALLDTYLFLQLAHFKIRDNFAGQLVGKMLITAAVLTVYGTIVAMRNKSRSSQATFDRIVAESLSTRDD